MKRTLLLTVCLLFPMSAMAADPAISANTCGSPVSSASSSDPYTTTQSVTVASGDTLMVVRIGARMVTKPVSGVVFNGTDTLNLAVAAAGNTMNAEIWYKINPTVATGNVVVTYANGGTYVWDQICVTTFTNTAASSVVDITATNTHDSSTADISLSGLTSTVDNAVFVDVLATNSGFATMTPETNRTLRMDGTTATFTAYSSDITVKTTAGNDTMPYTFSATQATEVGAVFKPATAGLPAALVGSGGLVGDGGFVGAGGLVK